MRVQNTSWQEHRTKAEIYRDITPISTIMAPHRACFADHCFSAKDQIISDVTCLRLSCLNRGRRPLNYMDGVARDTQQETKDLQSQMRDKDSWHGIVNSILDASA